MSATVIQGKPLAEAIRAEIADQVAEFTARTGVQPTLAAVLVGDDPASQVYVRNKQKACEQAGIHSRLIRLPEGATQAELLEVVQQLNQDQAVSGILVQLPLPGHIDQTAILDAVHPLKDVDAFHPENVGLIAQGRARFLPCTPHGVVQMLRRSGVETAGKHVVILGRSEIVGKPVAMMLVQKGADATVTVCHSRTPDLPAITRQADILIVAIGRPRFVTADMIKPGAAVVDVGINRTDDGKLVGDVDYAPAAEVAGFITPVPGGVGLLTVTMLLANTLQAAEMQQQSR